MPNTRAEILDAILAFINQETRFESGEPVDEHTRLLDTGILDSMMILSVMTFCDQELGVTISPVDVSEANFHSAGALADFVLQCRATAGNPAQS